MQLSSKPPKSASEPVLPDDRLSYLIDKLGIGGSNPMNITWGDLANVLVFLLDAEARRIDEADRNAAVDRGSSDTRAER